jgi:hypothetical protein
MTILESVNTTGHSCEVLTISVEASKTGRFVSRERARKPYKAQTQA